MHNLGRTSRGVARVARALGRYRRDVGLLEGTLVPMRVDLDDLALLEHVRQCPDLRALVNDRKLRIRTLEATLELLQSLEPA